MPLSTLSALLQQALSAAKYGQDPPALYDPVRYIMGLGGKRVRPLLVLLGANLYADDVADVAPVAVAVEIFHNFTLVHDDLMDAAPLRRGKPTVHQHWNANTAILSGDVMLVRAYEQLFQHVPDQHLRQILTLFSTCAAQVCEGQQLDMVFETQAVVSVEDYLQMIRLKTAVLLGFALEAGGILKGATPADAAHLRAFGEGVGMAFQLRDDLLDVYGDTHTFGKQVGGDILAAKKTFLLLTALNHLPKAQQAAMRVLLADISLAPAEKVSQVTALFNQVDVLRQTVARIELTYTDALAHLAAIEVPMSRKTTLRQLTNELMDRAA